MRACSRAEITIGTYAPLTRLKIKVTDKALKNAHSFAPLNRRKRFRAPHDCVVFSGYCQDFFAGITANETARPRPAQDLADSAPLLRPSVDDPFAGNRETRERALRGREARMRKHTANAPHVFERDTALEIGKRWQFSNDPPVQIEKLLACKIEQFNQ